MSKKYFDNNKLLFFSFFFALINALIIVFTEIEIFKSYFYTIVLFVIISFVLKISKYKLLNFFVLNVFVFFALILYYVLLYLMPDSYGFSGTYSGIGTDDSRFFSMISSNLKFVPRYAVGYHGWNHNFSIFLKLLYPFFIEHPLSIIIPNLIGICFIPFYTVKVYEEISNTKDNSKLLFFWILFCPLILSNGLILMRDGWVAFLTILCVFYIIKRQLLSFLVSLLILCYIRLGSGLVVALMPLFYFKEFVFYGNKFKRSLKVFMILIFVFILVLKGLPFVSNYLIEKGVSGFERQGFVENVIGKLDSKSMIYKIYSSPLWLKLPVGTVFFLLLPFFSVDFFYEGVFNVRGVMFSTIMPMISLFYFKYFFSGFFFSLKNLNEALPKKLFYMYFFSIFLISQISIQPRHKVSIIPLFYVLVAYGYSKTQNKKNYKSMLIVFALFLIQIYMLF